ncbi:hypothetical protein Tco_0967013 [Tanacetum coccineum]
MFVNDNKKEKVIKENSDSIASLRSEAASLKVKGSSDAKKQVQKAHKRAHELENQVENLQLEIGCHGQFKGGVGNSNERDREEDAQSGPSDSRFDNQSIERDRLIGIGFVLDFVEFILFTFSDKEMILVIEAVSR